MPSILHCPNCRAPLEPDPRQAVFVCQYCGAKSQNTLYLSRRPAPAPAPAGETPISAEAAKSTRRAVNIILVSIFGGILAITLTAAMLARRCSTEGMLGSARLLGPAAAAGDDEPAADRALGEKIEAYGFCIDRYTLIVNLSWGTYTNWASWTSGPSCDERTVSHGISEIYGPEDCARAVAAVRDKEPRLPELEQGGERLLKGLQELYPALKEGHQYYKSKDYLDDRCSKGKALHARFTAGFQAYDQGLQQIESIVGKQRRELLKRRVAHAERRGKDLRSLFLKALLDAHDLYLLLRKDLDTPVNVMELRFAAQAYQESSRALSRSADGHSSLSSFVREAEELLQRVKELVRAREEGKRGLTIAQLKRTIRPHEWSVSGTFPAVEEKYWELFFHARNVRFE